MTELDRYLDAATRQNTVRSYASALRHFEVEWQGHLPATPDSVARYLAAYAQTLATSTLRQRLAAIASWHRDHGFVDPTRSPLVRKVLKGIQTLHPGQVKQAAPLQIRRLVELDDWLAAAIAAAHARGDGPAALRHQRDRALVLLGFRTLELAAIGARERVNLGYYRSISHALTPATRTLIDELLRAPEGSRFTGWQSLKREPGRPTNKEVRFYLQHIRMLQQLADQLPPIDVPVPKLKQFRAMARAYDASELAELAPDKRYALATIFIRAQHAKTLDDAAELFIKQVRGLENTAQQKLLAYQLEHAKRADFLIGQLKEILQAYQLDGSDSQRVDAIDNSLEAEVSTLLAECEEHMAYAGKNYLPFMLQPYGAVRPLLFNGLELMKLRATSHDAGMEPLIAAVLSLRNQRRELIEVASLGLDPEKDFDWMSKLWCQHVFGKRASAAGAGWMHRKYFELAVLVQVKDELKSGDLFIPSSERFDDYREQLVDEATLAQELEAYGQVSGLPTDAESFVAGLRAQLTSLADEVDARFPENVHADILDGRLVLRKGQRAEVSSAITTVDRLIAERLPESSIVDVLIDASQWLDLHRFFRPIAGTESQVEDLPRRVITTLFCYGCNLGPTQTARSIKGFSRRQVAWLNLKYVTEDVLEKAIVEVINTYNKFDLPGYWGSGKSASADGTKWSVYEDNLLSEYHIRYGGRLQVDAERS